MYIHVTLACLAINPNQTARNAVSLSKRNLNNLKDAYLSCRISKLERDHE